MAVLAAVAAVAALGLAGCSGASSAAGGEPANTTSATGAGTAAGPSPSEPDREPPLVDVPAGHDGTTPMPLLLLLHGYSSNAEEVGEYFALREALGRAGILLVRPSGTKDPAGDRFWNATDACCDLSDTGVDDSAYLTGLLDELAGQYPVDPRRIYVMGHSNGGFMSHRMACDHADRLAAIVAVSGTMPSRAEDCTPSRPVSVLQVHGTDDPLIRYDGGAIGGQAFPGAEETVERWAALDGCTGGTSEGSPVDVVGRADIDSSEELEGAETAVRVVGGCPAGTGVQLWSVRGGAHVPVFTPAFADAVVSFLQDAGRP